MLAPCFSRFVVSIVPRTWILLMGAVILATPGPAFAGEQPKAKQQTGPPATKEATLELAPDADGWIRPFDGKTLANWEVLSKDYFEGHGKVYVKDGCLLYEGGQPATGVRFKGKPPSGDYEIMFEAKRVEGSDFFCGLTFPVEKGSLTLILGGWGGGVVGLSCLDGAYAADNETAQYLSFTEGRWYKIHIKVTQPKVFVSIDNEELISAEIKGRKCTVSWEMESCLPLGMASWNSTTGAVRNLRYRALKAEPSKEK